MRRAVIGVSVVAALAVAGVAMTRMGRDHTRVRQDRAVPVSPSPSVAQTPDAGRAVLSVPSDESARRAAVAAVAMTPAVFAAGFISRRDLIAGMATPRYAPQLADATSRQVNDLLVELGRRTPDVSGLSVVEEPVTASVQVTGPRGTARVWSVLVIVVPGAGPGRQLWRTTTVELELVDGRWLVDGWSSTPGPSPAPAAEGSFEDARELAPVMAWPSAYGEVR